MRFGGHETFAIREGWLHKGLKLIVESPQEFATDTAQDHLGVGRNMVKSIRHWLIATGLAERSVKSVRDAPTPYVLTPLGKLVREEDPFFLEVGTLWYLHINLVHNREQAYTWWWFFNYLNRDRFERAVCVEAMRRYLQLNEPRIPGTKTQQRDVACLLSTYARHYPPLRTDPEDGAECPFIELGLLDHFRDSGTFRLNQCDVGGVPAEVLGYALAKKQSLEHARDNFAQISVHEAAVQESSAGRVLRMNPERLHETAIHAGTELPHGDIEVVTLAGERHIKFRALEPLAWAKQFYDRREDTQTRVA